MLFFKKSYFISGPHAPIKLIAISSLFLFICEMVAMRFICGIGASPFIAALIESFVLLLLFSPALYFLYLKPFKEQNMLLDKEGQTNKAFADLSKALLEESAINLISDMILERAKKFTQSEYGFVGHIDSGTGALVATTMTTDIWDRCRIPGKTNIFHEFRGLFGWVLKEKASILTNNPQNDPRSDGIPDGHPPINRFLSVPAMFGNTLIGQIALANSCREYSDEDLKLVQQLADLYAIALKQKLTFESVKKSEERYKDLFENNPLIMWIYDIETLKFVAVNDTAVSHYGYSRDEFLAMTIKDIRPVEDIHALEKLIAVSKEGETNKAGIWRHIKKDGTTILVDITSHVINYMGKTSRIVFVNDVTTTQLAAEQSKLLHNLINYSNDSIFVINPDDAAFLYVNEKAATRLGYTRDELVRKKVYEIAANVQSPEQWKKQAERIRKGGNLVFESAQKHKDGLYIPVEVNASLIHYNNTEYIVSVARDISERKEAQESIIQEKNKLEAVVSALGDGLTLQDREFRILYQNKIHRDRQGDHVGEFCYKAYQNNNTICNGCLLLKCYEDGEVHRREISAETKTGTIFMEVSASPVKNSQGEIIGGIETVRDVTHRKHLESQLLQARKMEAIGTLAGGIAHDFNNILSAIIGYAELAQLKLEKTSTAYKDISQVIHAGDRAKELIKQILTFSRRNETQHHAVRVSSILKEALKLLRSTMPTTIEIKQDFGDENSLVMADPVQLHQIIMNLCTNAQYAMRQTGGLLSVRLENVSIDEPLDLISSVLPPGNYVNLNVSDEGHGIDPKNLPKIFEPYFTTKAQGEGTGIGLAVVHGIVTNMGGQIKVTSEPGKGTAFDIYLPLIKSDVEHTISPEKEAFRKGSGRILFVDDEVDICRIGQRRLQEFGYSVDIITNTTEALECVQNQAYDYDLIITDMTMPTLTGEQLARAIFEIRPDMPVILCTGFNENINEEKAKKLGIKELILKPLDWNRLSQTIGEIFDNRKKSNG